MAVSQYLVSQSFSKEILNIVKQFKGACEVFFEKESYSNDKKLKKRSQKVNKTNEITKHISAPRIFAFDNQQR